MRTFILCLIGSAIVGGGALGCGGGSDGPPDLTAYFKTTPYANAGCNAVDQRLSGQRPMRLYTNGNVALLPTTQGLASYYQRHALAFVTDAPAETTTMAYALDTDEASLDRALVAAFPGVDLSDEAALMATDPALYNQILTFVANFVLKPMVDFAAAHSASGNGVTNLVVLSNLERPGGQPISDPGTSLAGLSVSPALLAEFARTMPDESNIWKGVNFPAGFTPMMVLGNNILSQARAIDPVLDDLVTAHEFGHSGALMHVTTPLNLMYPSVTPGVDDCGDSLDDAQLTTLATTYGLGASAAAGALLADGAPRAVSPTARPAFTPDRLRAMLAGDRRATRAFVDLLFHGPAI
jgi:hypothetical protein